MSKVIAPDEIRQSVRDHYADLARKSSSCCGPNSSASASSCECQSSSNYPDPLANAVPEDIANFSLGRRDEPLRPGEPLEAVAVVSTDAAVPEQVLAELRQNPAVKLAKSVEFD